MLPDAGLRRRPTVDSQSGMAHGFRAVQTDDALLAPMPRVAPASSGASLRRALGRDWAAAWLFLLPCGLVLVGLIGYPFCVGHLAQLPDQTGRHAWRMGRFSELSGPALWPRPQRPIPGVSPRFGGLHARRRRVEIRPGHVDGAPAARTIPWPHVHAGALFPALGDPQPDRWG